MRLIELGTKYGGLKAPTLRLNRVPVNALNNIMQIQIREAIIELDSHNAPFIILEAHTCAGIDLREFEEKLPTSSSLIWDFARMFDAIASCNTPIVGLFGNPTKKSRFIGAGTTLAALCNYSLVQSDTILGYPECNFALKPSISAPYVVKKMGLNNAIYHFSTGELFTAQKARRFNLVSETCSPEEFTQIAEERIASFLNNPGLLIKMRNQTQETYHQEGFVIEPHMLSMVRMVEKAAELYADRSPAGRDTLINHTALELLADASTPEAKELLRRYLMKLMTNKDSEKMR